MTGLFPTSGSDGREGGRALCKVPEQSDAKVSFSASRLFIRNLVAFLISPPLFQNFHAASWICGVPQGSALEPILFPNNLCIAVEAHTHSIVLLGDLKSDITHTHTHWKKGKIAL